MSKPHEERIERISGEVFARDRQPGEPEDRFTAFAAYRNMGPGRTIKKLWFEVLSPGAEKMNGSIFNWSSTWKWNDRVAAYDEWKKNVEQAEKRRDEASEATRMERNKRAFRNSELYLAQQAAARAAEILSLPIVRPSFVTQKDGKTMVVKSFVMSPGLLLAAATLARASSDIGRKALGISDDESQDMTPDRFKAIFYRTTGEVAKDLPSGVIPPAPANPAVNPGILDAKAAADEAAADGVPKTADGTGGANAVKLVVGERQRP